MELDRLIETEQRNDALVRRAVEEADAIVRAAREAVARREAEFAAEVERLVAATEVALATERDRRLAAIAADGRAEMARYRAVTDARIASVALALIDELLTEGGRA